MSLGDLAYGIPHTYIVTSAVGPLTMIYGPLPRTAFYKPPNFYAINSSVTRLIPYTSPSAVQCLSRAAIVNVPIDASEVHACTKCERLTHTSTLF